ncbi:MAG: histone deacetylase [Verrucomicrobia bacterium]|jgi:acetoin utilization deacetylase AcuC-like enzyme|nr:histone deacetylase [Verrucomicrobiota bacterium]
MKIITEEQCTSYHAPGHPERPTRITRTTASFQKQVSLPIQWTVPGPCRDEQLFRAHTPHHLARLTQPHDFDGDTPYHPGIADRARASVGAALEALRLARGGEAVFSLMRPPGHHAMPDHAMGFCYLNNVAIAVLEALATGVEQVAVFDFDVHHGNGTEAILLNRKGVEFHSVHQSPCYPGTGLADVGNNCFNYPVAPGTPRKDYRHVLEKAIAAMMSGKPCLVAVSAGFDAYTGDPLAQGTLEVEDFHWLGERLRGLDVPVFSLLEGGYSTDLPDLIRAYLAGLSGL